MFNYQKIVIKIGSNVLTRADGFPDLDRLNHLSGQIQEWIQTGRQIVLVSSGAVAFGRSLNIAPNGKNSLANRQVWAATGQVKLMQAWQERFQPHQIQCAQVLVTKEDFRDRRHYLNMKQCVTHLMKQNVLPIINENDAVSITELMFTDNDELAGLIASMVGADALIILSNVDGIYDGDPKLASSTLIEKINPFQFKAKDFVVQSKSSFGRGGMITKANMAKKIARLGIAVHIANGRKDHILRDLWFGQAPHTYIKPAKSKNERKKWLAHSEQFSNGEVKVNEGAKQALFSAKATSLLPVGIVDIIHPFEKGDIVRIIDEQGQYLGLGIAEYGAIKARERMGLQQQKVLIHYDYLFLEPDAIEG